MTVDPNEARDMILEARAFCRYLRRAHGLENAEDCLAIVEDDEAIDALHAALANPHNWGMAKSMMMAGKAKGYDISSREGIEQWMGAYNASLPPSTSAVSTKGCDLRLRRLAAEDGPGEGRVHVDDVPRGPCVSVSRRSRRAPSTWASVMNVRRRS